jgi:hypothetical protein
MKKFEKITSSFFLQTSSFDKRVKGLKKQKTAEVVLCGSLGGFHMEK